MSRLFVLLLVLSVPIMAQSPAAPAPQASAPAGSGLSTARPQHVGTMSELMINLIYPTSDAILYIATRQPANEVEWNELGAKALTLAEAANLLMMPGRARDQGQWMDDAKLMLDAGAAAFKAAKNRDLPALEALNEAVYVSCTSCHRHYRAGYGRGRGTTR